MIVSSKQIEKILTDAENAIKDPYNVSSAIAALDSYYDLTNKSKNKLQYIEKYQERRDTEKDSTYKTKTTTDCEGKLKKIAIALAPYSSIEDSLLLMGFVIPFRKVLYAVITLAICIICFSAQSNIGEIALAYHINETIESADLNKPDDLGKIKGAALDYEYLSKKIENLQNISSLRESFEITYKENNYILTNDGVAKVTRMSENIKSFLDEKNTCFRIPGSHLKTIFDITSFIVSIIQLLLDLLVILKTKRI